MPIGCAMFDCIFPIEIMVDIENNELNYPDDASNSDRQNGNIIVC